MIITAPRKSIEAVRLHTVAENIQGINYFAYICLNFFSAINEIAMSEFIHVHLKIKNLPYFKHELKKNTKECFKELQRLVSEPEKDIQDLDNYHKFVDYCDDDISINIEELRSALLKFLTKKGVEEAALWADLEVTRLIFAEINRAYHDIADETRQKYGGNITGRFHMYDPSRVVYLFDLVRRDILSRQDIYVNPNEYKTATNALSKLHKKLVAGHFLKRSINKAKKDRT